METDDLHSEVSKLQLLIQEEDNKMTKYKVSFLVPPGHLVLLTILPHALYFLSVWLLF